MPDRHSQADGQTDTLTQTASQADVQTDTLRQTHSDRRADISFRQIGGGQPRDVTYMYTNSTRLISN